MARGQRRICAGIAAGAGSRPRRVVGRAGRDGRASAELTVEYSKQRYQFGRPIGGFQALKHRMADAYVRTEAARSASVAGLMSALHGGARLPLDAAVAMTVCSEALQHAAAEMIQLHGGIAITWEHDARLYFKRAHGSAQLFGQPAEFTDAIAGLAVLRSRSTRSDLPHARHS